MAACKTEESTVSGYAACLVKVNAKSGDTCYSARTVGNTIQVFNANRRTGILSCPGLPLATELQRNEAKWLIWVAVPGGAVYRKEVSMICSVSRSADNDIEMLDEDSNQSIFDDLLKNQQPPSSSSQNLTVKILPADQLLSAAGEVRKIMCLKDFLVLICVKENNMSLHWYSLSKLLPLEVCSENCVPVMLPYKTVCVNQATLHQQLTCVVVITTGDDSGDISSSQLQIPLHLFSAVFGVETSIKSLPVLLFGLRDGSLFYLPLDLNSLAFKGVKSDVTSPWRLLCSLSSSIVDVCHVKASRKLTEKEVVAIELQRSLGLNTFVPSNTSLDSLVIVSSCGQCCLLTAVPDPSTDGRLSSIMRIFTLPSSVVCCCSEAESLFVSTGHSLERCSLLVYREGERDRYRVEVTHQELQSASVTSMWLSGEPKTLMCETSNGDLVEFDMTLQSTSNLKDLGGKMQPSLKEILVSIDINSQKMEQLKSSHLQLNDFIQQMNIASRCLHSAGGMGDQGPSPISCDVTLKSEIAYHATEHFVIVKVKNQGAVSLTKDWSVVANLTPMCKQPPVLLTAPMTSCTREFNERNATKTSDFELPVASHSSHTMALSHGLLPGQALSFKLPIAYNSSLVGTTVSVHLVFQCPQELFEKALPAEMSQSDPCMFVPVSTTIIDVLHYMRVRLPSSTSMTTHTTQQHSAVESMVAQVKPGQSDTILDKRASVQSSQTFTMSIDIPGSFSRLHQLTTTEDHIRRILTGCQTDMSTFMQASCTLQDPCGSLLTLSVETKPDQRSCDVSPLYSASHKSVAMVLKSLDVSLLAKARLAIVYRLQMCPGQITLTVGGLQKVISAAEGYQQQLQNIQDRATRHEHGVLPALRSLYENMRNLPL